MTGQEDPGLFRQQRRQQKENDEKDQRYRRKAGKGLNNAGQIRAVFRIGQQLSHALAGGKIGLRIDLYADTVFHPALAEPEAEAAKKRDDQ